MIKVGDGIFFIKLKNTKWKLFYQYKKKTVPKCIRVLAGNPSYGEWMKISIGFGRRKTVMTEAGQKRFCKKGGIDIKCFEGK